MGDGTELGRVRGLGSARHGAHHWMLQRFTAVGNILGGLFLAFSLALQPTHDFAAMKDWVAKSCVGCSARLKARNSPPRMLPTAVKR